MLLSPRAIACLCAAISTTAAAHELSCEQTFNGERILVVDSYPTTIAVRVVVHNEHPTSPSEALSVTSELLPPASFETPFTLPVGASQTALFYVTVNSPEECAQLAGTESLYPDHLVSTVEVTWDLGSAQCSAELICQPAVCQ